MSDHDEDYAFAEVDEPYVDEDGILVDPNAPRDDEDHEPAELDFGRGGPVSAMGPGDALLAIGQAAERLAQAVAKEMRLADERALIKDAAIVRIVESGQERSATAAEKVVEKDPEYMEHRRAQYESVKERIRAQAEYDSAVIGARLSCSLGEALNERA